MEKVIKFKNCQVHVWPESQYLETRFPDGTVCKAAPEYSKESRARAEVLGYGTDLWAMTLDHELGHTILAEMDNLDVSPALWAVAHPEEPRNFNSLHREECRVLELQRFVQLRNKAIKKLTG